MMKKRSMALLLTAALVAGTLGGCSGSGQQNNTAQEQMENGAEESGAAAGEEAEGEIPGQTDLFPVKDAAVSEEIGVTPSVAPYTVEADLSNIDNLRQFYLTDEQKELLAQNGFVVFGDAGREFFEIYEGNRYVPVASFVTVDSLMHTYHLYFAHLLKKVEKEYLADCLEQLSKRMLDNSMKEYDSLKGSEWEEAAKRNAAFFTVGAKLLDDKTEVKGDVKEIAEYELEHIMAAEKIDNSMMYDSLTPGMEDYTQYKPRGYYEGDEELERYFRAMMWYGRIHFRQDSEEMDRSALLMAQALSEDEAAYGLWVSIYEVTTFFSGASDDAGVYEYIPLIKDVYGEDVSIQGLIGNEEGFKRFHTATANLRMPLVNSIPIEEGDDNVIPGFRFMGQRFTIDAAIMQKLVFSSVGESADGDRRMLPDVLDVPAALGSDTALSILEESGVSAYSGYTENMGKLREALAAGNKELWSASLYSNWLNTLRPLLEVKGEGYPMFMQGEEWRKKELECFAGSYTELKHDTILYTKQVLAEMGDAYDETADDRGYVEPEPLVYLRFKNLSELTAQGLKGYGMLSEEEEENLSRLTEMADRLLEISKKELRDEVLADDEYEFIRSYGGNIEHFWMETVKDMNNGEGVATQEAPAALVVDIATNPNGEVLEAGTDDPSIIYVVVKVDGKLKIASGSVYTFHQFRWPIEDRLTDDRWHQMMGIKQNEEGTYEADTSIRQPEWTQSYRYTYE